MSNEGKPEKKKYRWRRWLIEILVIVMVIIAVRAWQYRDAVEGMAPDFQAVSLAGDVVKLSEFKGQPLLLHFWAEWCPFCKFEESTITAINKDWPVLTVAFQSGDDRAVQQYMRANGIDSWLTVNDENRVLANLYSVRGVPTSYILDASGYIRFVESGLSSGWGLRLRLWWAKKFPASDKTVPLS